MILVVNLPRRQYYSKCVLVDIHIYYHFRKDERPGDGQTCLFYLILLGLVFVSRRVVFMPAKPMWKLYLVWAILSSVPLLYVFSNRCHVMSTINTHKHKHKRTRATCWLPPRQFFVFVVAIFFFYDSTRASGDEKKAKKRVLFLFLCQCERQDAVFEYWQDQRSSSFFLSSLRLLTVTRSYSHLLDFISELEF